MLNQVVIVGKTIEITGTATKATLKLSCDRSFKNNEGIYETDIITVKLFKGIAENTMKHLEKGDVVGIKGRIETINEQMEITAERLTFLSKKSDNEIN